MEGPTSRLELIGERIRSDLSVKHAAREEGLQLAREIIRYCANAIRSVHRNEQGQAQALLDKAQALIAKLAETMAGHSDLLHTGFVHDAHKEYAEASVTLALISGQPLPGPNKLGISHAAYLNGLGEAVGELRRHLLDILRDGKVARCEELLGAMDDIYSLLVTIDFPDALTGGLRRTTDVVRGIMEKTRGDLTMSLRQRDLEQRLGEFEHSLGSRFIPPLGSNLEAKT